MKTFLSIIAGLTLLTATTASARDYHHGGYVHRGYVGHYHSGFSFGLGLGPAYVDPYYGYPAYSAPVYPYYYSGPSVYYSGGRYYHHGYSGGHYHSYSYHHHR